MKKRSGMIIVALLLIIVGIGYTGNVFNIWSFSIFFYGWWTLFIIIPCLVSVINDGFSPENIVGILIGLALFLASNDVISISFLFKLAIPVLLIFIGFSIIFKEVMKKNAFKTDYVNDNNNNNNNDIKNDSGRYRNKNKIPYYNAIFNSQDVKFENEFFIGATLNSVFGSIELCLTNSIIENDVNIDIKTIFGGIDIKVPSNVKVIVSDISVFGGVDNEMHNSDIVNIPTIYIRSTCVFGGINIKQT